jgi:dTDP-4-dehydrorhamnose 3,5-epimerase
MIDGVRLKTLRVVPDERGRLMEILRKDDELFRAFGQVYVTTTYPGVVKAWHRHARQTDNIACVAGMIKVALYDDREGSPTRGLVDQFYLGVHAPALLQVPAGVWHGWMGVSLEEAVIVNVPTEAYDRSAPDEQRRDAHDPGIPYDWARKDG